MGVTTDKKIYCLTLNNIYFISIFYLILFCVGCIISAKVFYIKYFVQDKIPIIVLTIIGCCGTSLLGSIIYYFRKIYLICINERVDIDQEYSKLKNVGNIIYFCIRPLFSVVVAITIIIGIYVGLFVIFISDGTIKDTFMELSMVMTFFLSVSNGRIMDNLERIGSNLSSKLF